MNKSFKTRVKVLQPLTLEQLARKYALKKSDVAKIAAFVSPGKRRITPRAAGGKGSHVPSKKADR
jgi:hypothetical protein